MKQVYILGESLQGETYKLFMGFLISKSDAFSYEILKSYDQKYDAEDKKYYENVLKSEMIFRNFYKEKNIDERNNLKSLVYLNNSVVKEYLKSTDSIYHWNYPNDVENLSFFKNDTCIFESVTHENYFVFYLKNESEIDKLKEYGVSFISKKS